MCNLLVPTALKAFSKAALDINTYPKVGAVKAALCRSVVIVAAGVVEADGVIVDVA